MSNKVQSNRLSKFTLAALPGVINSPEWADMGKVVIARVAIEQAIETIRQLDEESSND